MRSSLGISIAVGTLRCGSASIADLNLSWLRMISRTDQVKSLLCLPLQNLYLFLAQPNCLVHLDLSWTDCTVDSVCIQRPSLTPPSPPRGAVSSAESQSPPGQNKRNTSQLMNNRTAGSHEKHKTAPFHGFVYIATVILPKFSIRLN